MLKDNIIIKHLTLFILPYIILYSLYIQINGETSPGGGFQSGVIFASACIALDLLYGEKKYFSKDLLLFTAILGVIIYATTGAIPLIFDDSYINYYAICSDKILAQHLGIFLIEAGVGLTVASTMCLIYSVISCCEQ